MTKRKPRIYQKIKNLSSYRCYPPLKQMIKKSRTKFTKKYTEDIMANALQKEIEKLMRQ